MTATTVMKPKTQRELTLAIETAHAAISIITSAKTGISAGDKQLAVRARDALDRASVILADIRSAASAAYDRL